MKRVLFVDDESKILDGIRRMLHGDRKRWDMQFALGGDAALQACEAQTFDLVISDMRMPGMDGAALLSRIRELYPSSARVILSGYSELSLTMRAVPVAHRYLVKPCDATDLRSMIERVFALQDIMSSAEIQQIVGMIGELPSLSSSYTALAEAVQAPDVSIEKVANIIAQDLAMSAKVLQLVNSGFFGLGRAMNDVHSAVRYLGIDTVKNLALTSEAFRIFVPDPRIPSGTFEAIQKHAQRTAAIAGALPIDPKMRDVTVVAALLHDIGLLVLASKMPNQFCSALSLATEHNYESFEAEEQLMGISHAEIGAYLLGLWGVPSLAVEAIAHHHHPARIPHSGFDCSVAVYVADLLAHQNSREQKLQESDRVCLETLGVWPQFTELRDSAVKNSN